MTKLSCVVHPPSYQMKRDKSNNAQARACSFVVWFRPVRHPKLLCKEHFPTLQLTQQYVTWQKAAEAACRLLMDWFRYSHWRCHKQRQISAAYPGLSTSKPPRMMPGAPSRSLKHPKVLHKVDASAAHITNAWHQEGPKFPVDIYIVKCICYTSCQYLLITHCSVSYLIHTEGPDS